MNKQRLHCLCPHTNHFPRWGKTKLNGCSYMCECVRVIFKGQELYLYVFPALPPNQYLRLDARTGSFLMHARGCSRLNTGCNLEKYDHFLHLNKIYRL